MRKILIGLLAACAACTGCRFQDLAVDESVRLVLRVHDTLPIIGPVAAIGRFETHLFDGATGQLAETAYTASDGGTIFAAAGPYDLVSFNFDTESVLFEGESTFSHLRAVSVPAVENGDAIPVIGEPGCLFAAHLGHLNLPVRHEGDVGVVLTVDAWPIVQVWRLVVEGVEGQEHLSSASGYLTGMASGRFLGSGEPTGEAVQRVSLRKDPVSSRLEACFTTFGCLPDTPHWLHLLLTDTNGGRYPFSIDVTGLCDPSADGLELSLPLDFAVPEPEQGGGGFAPVPEDWQVIEHPIHL